MKSRQKIRRGMLFFSFILFPITIFYFSPVLILEGASRGIITGSAVVFGVLFFSSLFFGRFFCGWICPGGGLQEIISDFRNRPARRKRINWIKYVIWVIWFGFFLFLLLRAGGVREVDVLFGTTKGISVADLMSIVIYFFFTGLIVLLSMVLGRRGACHSICWMAPFMVVGRKIGRATALPALKLNADSERCTHCSACTKQCPMSIDVTRMVDIADMNDPDCILCGSCADVCPESVIRLSFEFNEKEAGRQTNA
jgi:polyferredoxin